MSAVPTTTKEERVIVTAKQQAEALGYDTERMRCYVIPFYCDEFMRLLKIILALKKGESIDKLRQPSDASDVWTVYFEPIPRPGFSVRGGDVLIWVKVETGEVVKYLMGQ